MPEKIIATCTTRRLDILDESGAADESLLPAFSDEKLRDLYALFVLTRTFDHRALNLQREGRLGTYAPILGQEASQIGSALACDRSDWIFPSFREMGVLITLGYPLRMLFQYWSGDERGLRTPDDLNIFPISVPVGTHVLHAVGAAMAMRYRKDPAVALAYFGDGGTSKGDFHEGLNFAGVFRLPIVFICQNNQWAISVPRERQTASATIAQKACAYGIEGIQVDGNDVFAVYRATREAIDRARRGDGATLIECYTYRIADHTTADDASRYRTPEQVEVWKAKDPLLRLRLFLGGRGIWSEAFEQEVAARAEESVTEAVKAAEAVGHPQPSDIISYTGALPTPRQQKQLGDF